MLNISGLNKEQKTASIWQQALWQQAFRPFFLFACIFSIL